MNNIVLEKTWVQGRPVQVDNLLGTTFVGEAGAHTFRISGIDADQASVPITGTITGKLLAANNVTVPLEGSASDGVAELTLTEDCYVIPGRFILSIYAENDDVSLCIYCCVGNVFRTESDIVEYPSATIPDIQALIDAAQAVAAEVPGIVTAAQTAVDGIEDQKDTMIASIASVAGQGTDTTLTQSGVAADAKAAGDQVSALKSASENLYKTVETKSATNNNYIAISNLKSGVFYRIAVTVSTSGTYTIRAGNAASTSGTPIYLLENAVFVAGQPQYIYYTPSVGTTCVLRISQAVSWSATIYEAVSSSVLSEDVNLINGYFFGNAETISVTNNNYATISTLVNGKKYKIGITVQTDGVYTIKAGTGPSSGAMVSTLLADERLWANATRYVYFTPSVDGIVSIRNSSSSVTWSVKVEEFFTPVFEDYVTPEIYGAVGDGIADDTAALQAAFDSGKPIISKCEKTYRITFPITITSTKYVDFNRSTIKADNVDNDHPYGQGDSRYQNVLYVNRPDNATLYGYLANVIVDCNNIALCGLYVSEGKRDYYTGWIIKNCIQTGACFVSAGGSAVRDWYLYGGDSATHVSNLNTAIEVRTHDMTFDSVDFVKFMRGMFCRKGGLICSKLHGFITGTNEIAAYHNAVFVEIEKPGRYTFSDSYPDTQGIHYKIDDENVYLIVNGGSAYTAALSEDDPSYDASYAIGETLIAAHGPIYAFYAPYKEYLQNVVVSNYTISCLNLVETGYTCYLSNFCQNPAENLMIVGESVNAQQDGVYISRGFGVTKKICNALYGAKKVDCLGDSFTYVENNGWWKMIGAYTGWTMQGYGVISSRISKDFTRDGVTIESFLNRYDDMDTTADAVVIFGGVNDCVFLNNGTITLGDMTSALNSDTFYGALRLLIESIHDPDFMPDCKILGIIPPDFEQDAAHLTWLPQVQEAEREIFSYYGIPYVDLQKDCQEMYESEYNLAKYRRIANNDYHPSTDGYKAIASIILGGLEKIFNGNKF